MENNQQANSLVGFENRALISEPIELKKELLKSLKKGNWIEIEQGFLKVDIVKYEDILQSANLLSDGLYFFLETKESINKKLKIKKQRDSFRIKYILSRDIFAKRVAISKAPLDVILTKNKKDFAKANLYIAKNIYLEIKEIL
jgi:hypothetical protein